jgi:hypothetical protein
MNAAKGGSRGQRNALSVLPSDGPRGGSQRILRFRAIAGRRTAFFVAGTLIRLISSRSYRSY